MTAHSPETAEAADVRSLELTDDAAADAFDTIFADPEEGEAEESDDELEPEEGEGEEADELDEEEGDEPDEPAIEAPSSLTADEKATFAQLPPEAQRVWAASETRRNQQVQQATTAAAEAQRQAKASAADAEATAKATYAQQYRAFIDANAPRPPDANLAYTNPGEYVALDAQYRAHLAQHTSLVQQVDALAAEAEQHFTAQQQQWEAEQVRELMKVPEYADPARRVEFLSSLEPIGNALGYSADDMANAGAKDILALRYVAGLKAKADKLDVLQSRKMQRVRDAKSSKPNAALPVKTGAARQLSEAQARLKQTGSDADAVRAFELIGR